MHYRQTSSGSNFLKGLFSRMQELHRPGWVVDAGNAPYEYAPVERGSRVYLSGYQSNQYTGVTNTALVLTLEASLSLSLSSSV